VVRQGYALALTTDRVMDDIRGTDMVQWSINSCNSVLSVCSFASYSDFTVYPGFYWENLFSRPCLDA
jgi:hypothetical protein